MRIAKVLSLVFLALQLCGCAARKNQAVVVWISIDGMRGDYVSPVTAPFLSELANRSAFSRELVPVFPSLTFPSHVSQATGVSVARHGITSNTFYDSSTKETYKFPADASLMQAEGIWLTAARQGVGTAVFDWPMSYPAQSAAPDGSSEGGFDKDLSDADRLNKLLTAWRADRDKKPLRLLMAYIHAPDVAGHKHGPDAPETRDAVKRTDAALRTFHREAAAIFESKMGKDDELYFIITTDHGMASVRNLVNLSRLLGDAWSKELKIVTGGPTAHIFLDGIPDSQRSARRDAILRKLRGYDIVNAWARSDLPARWNLKHPTRTGDVFVLARTGYTFTSRREVLIAPVGDEGAKGMHGYDPANSPDMLGYMVISRHRSSLGGRDLGRVDSLQLHPTVAKLLGIQPAPLANAKAMELRR